MSEKLNMNKEVEIGCPIHGSFFVTPNNHLGYNKELIAYGCPICEDKKEIVITEDNIHLYYEFMGDDDKNKHSIIVDSAFSTNRFYTILKSVLNIDRNSKNKLITIGEKSKMRIYIKNIYADTIQIRKIGMMWFNIKDTLKPIEEYIAEIKASSEYKEYIASLV